MKPANTPLGPKAEITPDFATRVEQVEAKADALHSEEERTKLHDVLFKHQDSFAKDSLDCGFNDLYSAQIPTHLNAPRTYICQYKIPLASYEPIQEIIDSLLSKGII